MSQKTIFTLSALGISFFVSLGILFSYFDGFANRSPSYVELKKQTNWPDTYNRTEDCNRIYGGDQYCLISDISSEPTHLLLGDSHANHFYLGLRKALTENSEYNLLMTGAGGCPPLIGIDMGYVHTHGSDLKCYQRTNAYFANLINNHQIEHVYLAFDEASLFDDKILPKDMLEELDFENNRYEAVKGALKRTLEAYERRGIAATVIEDMPDSTFDNQFQRCVWALNSISRCNGDLRTVNNHSSYYKLLDELSEEGFNVLRTNHALQTVPLIGKDATEVMYRDSTHLSRFGSEAVVKVAFLGMEN